MHRSGTSFLARALNISGLYLGSKESLTLTESNANEANPRGHWESREFIRLGKETRVFNKYFYHNVPEKIIIPEKLGNEIKNAAEKLMQPNSVAAGFKDPHCLLYLDSWYKYLPKSSVIVGIFRHPLKVAESLKIRDGRHYEESLLIWKLHNVELLKSLEKHGGFLLNFDWSKEKLLSSIYSIIEKLSLVKTDLSEWYTERLFRSDKTYDSEYPLSDEIKEIYSKLIKISEKTN